MHGGVISALLDAAMTHCLFHNGIKAMTADLHIRYRKPVPCNGQVSLKARITFIRPPLYCLASELLCGGKLMAKGCAKFMLVGD
jgi:acyl-coenzyme A thioesterase PaaI-like protein